MQPVVVGVVGESPTGGAIVRAIEAAGGVVATCTETTLLGASDTIDALLIDLTGDVSRFSVAAAALASEPRTRWLPRIIVAPAGMPIDAVTPFGPALILSAGDLSQSIAAGIADAIEQVRARLALERDLHAENEDLRTLAQSLVKVQQEVATLSHDARVLFGLMMGYASNLRDGIAGPVTELQRSHAANIVEASGGASSLVDRHVAALRALTPKDAAPFARSLAPRLMLRRRQHDLSEVVRAVVALFQGIAEAKEIRLLAVAEHPVPCWCDAMQIKQGLINLLSNALKFTPPGGTVDVDARFGQPASTRGGNTERRDVEIVVSDSGVGIPVGERERVFERGVRLERDRLIPGSGIGLSVVRDVLERHGGAVRVEDAAAGGASFVLTLPSDLRERSSERAPATVTVLASSRPPRTSGSPPPGRD
jgi:signal transduction histidine kinase